MSDLKKKFLSEMMDHVGKGVGGDLKSRYAPKAPAADVVIAAPAEPEAPAKAPAWDELVAQHPEILEALMAALKPAEKSATVVVAKPTDCPPEA